MTFAPQQSKKRKASAIHCGVETTLEPRQKPRVEQSVASIASTATLSDIEEDTTMESNICFVPATVEITKPKSAEVAAFHAAPEIPSPPLVRELSSSRLHLITPKSSALDLTGACARLDKNSSSESSTLITVGQTTISVTTNAYVDHAATSSIGRNLDSDTMNNMSLPITHCMRTDLPSIAGKQQQRYWRLLARFATIVALGCCFLLCQRSTIINTSTRVHVPNKSNNTNNNNDCVYVPGGGFSGFWFTLGRLQSVSSQQQHARTYYCYSAGCLAVVATWSGHTLREMYDMAGSVQHQWKQGTIHRHDVVAAFLNQLVRSEKVANAAENDPTFWNRLHIITSAPASSKYGQLFGGLQPVVRQATNLDELYTMLLQTTWIPYAVGSGLWHENHMDGAFTMPAHPSCAHTVGLAMNLNLFANVVNVNLGRDKVEHFWNLGKEYGF
jgi:hypothetical protein